MHLDILNQQSSFEQVSSEWNQFLTRSASLVPFLRHEFLYTWFKTLGGGEWSHGELLVILGRHPNGDLAGIAPLFYSADKIDEPSIMFLGTKEISDYLDFITELALTRDFLKSVLEYLGRLESPAWKTIDLYNILESSPTLTYLPALAAELGWQYQQDTIIACPTILLPDDWEMYLAGIKKKQRHEIRRKMKRMETQETPFRWFIVNDETLLDQEIDAFLKLMENDDEKQIFLSRVMHSQMKAAIHAAFQAGWLQLAFLEIGGKKAAGFLNFDFNNKIWVYNSGIDPAFYDYSPGWVLLGYLLKWAIENGRSEFDFMRGEEDYKYRFGAKNRVIVHATISR